MTTREKAERILAAIRASDRRDESNPDAALVEAAYRDYRNQYNYHDMSLLECHHRACVDVITAILQERKTVALPSWKPAHQIISNNFCQRGSSTF